MAVEFEQRGPFAVVKINRPESGNAAALQTERGGFGGITQRERTKPIIAAVDGPALAGGTEIVLSCDLVVASTNARFGIPEVKRSLVAGAGGLFRLTRQVVLDGMLADDDTAWKLTNKAMATVISTEDFAEGPRAFIEKRAPEW